MAVNAGEVFVTLTVDGKDFEVGIKNAGVLLKSFSGTLDKTATSVQKLEDHTLGLGQKFRDTVVTLGNFRFVAMDINDVFLKLPLSILKTAGELERMQVMMTGLSKETTKAGKDMEGAMSFQFVTDMAKKTPFELSAIADSFVKLKSAGIDPTKGSLLALTDSVAKFGGTGETLKRATVAIQQMVGKGVVSMEELRQQLGEAAPQAMKNMADGMGLTMSELANIIQKGVVKAEPALNKMFQRMRIENEGAADAMMQTWTGLTSRLKTEWELTAKDIADAGLGKAAGEAVKDLTASLDTQEFRRFAKDIGADMGDITKEVIAAGKTLVEYRGAIMDVAEAWLYYKVATSVIYPAFKTISDVVDKAGEIYTSTAGKAMAAANTEAAARKAGQMAVAEATAQQLRTIQAAAADEIMVKQATLATLEAEQAAYYERMRLMQKALATAGDNVSGAALVARMPTADVNAINQNAAAQRALKSEIKAVQDAMVSTGAEIVSHAARTVQLEKATGAATLGMRALAGTKALVTTAFAAMGGAIGLVTIAIMAGVWAWQKWGQAAEEAAARKRRADMGTSSQKDVDAAKKARQEAEAELAAAKANAAYTYSNPGLDPSAMPVPDDAAQTAAKAQAVRDAEAKLREAISTEKKSTQALMEQNARDDAAIGTRANNQSIDAIKEQGRSKQAALELRKVTELKGLDENSKDYQAKYKAINAEELQNQIDTDRAVKAQQQSQLDTIEKGLKVTGLSDQQKKSLETQRADLLQGIALTTNQLESGLRAQNSKIDLVTKETKPTKGNGLTRIEQLIASLKSDRAELESAAQSFNATLGIVNEGDAAAARLTARIKNKVFNSNNGATAPSAAEIKEAVDLTRKNANLQNAMRIAEDIAQKGRAIEGDYQRAIQTIANPLGDNTKGSLGNLQDELKKTGKTIEDVAKESGQSVTGLTTVWAQAQARAATIDLAAGMKESAKSTQELTAQVILDDRERTRIQMDNDTALYKARMEKAIEAAKVVAKATNNPELLANADKLTEEMNKNLEARAKATTFATRTPMEQMVDDWSQSTKKMQEATVGWTEDVIDGMVTMAKTGKFEWGGLVKDILAGILKIQLQKTIGAGINSGISALTTAASSYFGFANGGIMSAAGSMPLKKYANGGVATSPQLALFGEGSMNEAYVPLPDGRRIPVDLQNAGTAGAGTTNVAVNVVNQTSTPVNASTGTPRFDGKQMILDVVLTAASQPGSFRDGMMGAMK